MLRDLLILPVPPHRGGAKPLSLTQTDLRNRTSRHSASCLVGCKYVIVNPSCIHEALVRRYVSLEKTVMARDVSWVVCGVTWWFDYRIVAGNNRIE